MTKVKKKISKPARKMDFGRVLGTLSRAFARKRVKHGLMGGGALNVMGIARTTYDLDYLVALDDLERVYTVMKLLGYKLIHRSDDVSHFEHEIKAWGSVDFLHAYRQPSLKALRRRKKFKIGRTRDWTWVLAPEDMIGFKVQAISNEPSRMIKDALDIEHLCRRFGNSMDWSLVRSYYELFNNAGDVKELERAYGTKVH